MLSAIATAAISVAGVVFSITIVALTLAAQQFGPRLLRNFMSDRGNQVVLGTFIATFVYCLLILRSVRGGDEQAFVPYISVVTGLVLAILSLGVLIFFIHHVSASIQAPNLIAAVARDLEDSIDRLFPDELGREYPEQERAHPIIPPPRLASTPRTILAPASDYIQAIDNEALISLAQEHDLFIKLIYRPGAFVIEGETVALVWPDRADAQKVFQKIQGSILLGTVRTATQDVYFAVNQLVEVAVRSLSAGINDPFTATNCVDRLGAALAKFAGRKLPAPFRSDRNGELRVVVPVVSFSQIADLAFDQIRQYGSTSVPVLLSLLETICKLAAFIRTDDHRIALVGHLQRMHSVFDIAARTEWDRSQLESRYRKALRAIETARSERSA
jgi:uncharacterized membrane protein